LLVVVNPHEFEFHYKTFCPYCKRTERYLLNPLELKGIIRLVRVNIDLMPNIGLINENIRFSRYTGLGDKSAPILIDRKCGLYFIPMQSKGEKEDVKKAIQELADSLLFHLFKSVRVRDGSGVRFLRPEDVKDPLIMEAWGMSYDL